MHHQLNNSKDGALMMGNAKRTRAKAKSETNPVSEQKVTLKLLFQIFVSFLKIGPVTFGGGYAMIPLIEKEVVTNRKWVQTKDIADVFAVAESVPGAIAINSSTFIGYRLAGVRGAIAAMLGVLLPTFAIVVGLSIFFLSVQGHPKVEAAFEGIRPAIVALITYAGYKIGKTAIIDKTTLAIVVATTVFLLLVHVHPVLIIASGAILGMLIVFLRGLRGLETKLEKEEDSEADSSASTSSTHHYKDKDYFFGDGI